MKKINIFYLYPKEMNIYGDFGNIITLVRRITAYKYEPNVINYSIGDRIHGVKPDIIIGGGGQDKGQELITADLQKIKNFLSDCAQNFVPALLVCGLYQLYGKYYKTPTGQTFDGVSVFDMHTIAKKQRIIGNIVTHSDVFNDIVGYENHGGQTYLTQNSSTTPLAISKLTEGNNLDDNTEGAVYKNTIGTYLHGSILPKNPLIADFLIENAIKNNTNNDFCLDQLKDIDKTFLQQADLAAQMVANVIKNSKR